jgi:alpha-2-macroglobulin
MDIIDKLFSKLNREKSPVSLKEKIFLAAERKPSKNLFSLKIAASALAAIVLVMGGVYYQYFRIADYAAAFELQPEQSDTAGVTPNSAFILKTSVDLSEFQVKKIVKFDPEIDFSVESIGNKTFRLKPVGDLAPDKIYKVIIPEGAGDRDYSWAYQIKAPFQVINTIPGNRTGFAPVGTGIEMNFNREGFINPENHFEINPKVEGRFEQRGSTLVFIPKNPFAAGTIYTVTVKSGLAYKDAEGKPSEDMMPNDYVFRFETEPQQGFRGDDFIYLSRDTTQYLPNIKPVVTLYASESIKPQAVVYKFNSGEDYINNYSSSRDWDLTWAGYYMSRLPVKTEGLNKVLNFNPEIKSNAPSYDHYFEFPSSLSNGYYLLQINSGSNKYYQWFQVTSLAHYSSFSFEKSTVWLQDFTKKSGVGKANISLISNKVGETNADGLSVFNTPDVLKTHEQVKTDFGYYAQNEEPKVNWLKVTAPGYNDYFILVKDSVGFRYSSQNSVIQGSKYWEALTTDRPVYRPEDEINFWGVLMPRDGSKLQDEIKISLTNYEYDYSQRSYGTHDLVSTKINPSETGTYQGKLSFSGLTPKGYLLVVSKNGETISSKNIVISDFSKPVYKITVTPARTYVYMGDEMEVTAKVEFYDGTPLGRVPLKYSYYYENEHTGEIITNAEGIAKFKVKFNPKEDYGPRNVSIGVGPKSLEEGDIAGNAYVSLYRSAIVMDAKAEKINDRANRYTVKISELIPDSDDQNYLSSYRSGNALANHSVSAEVHKITYTKNRTGEYYDFIQKIVVPTYYYSSKDEIIETLSGQTGQDGKWSIEKNFPVDDNSYYVKFLSKDNVGRSEFSYPVYSWYTYESQYYTGYWRLTVNGNLENNKMKMDEEYTLDLYKPQDSQIESSKTLFIQYQSSINKAELVNGLSYKDKFQGSYRPGVSYIAVVMTKDGFAEAHSGVIAYDKDEAQLHAQINPDKNKYRPGEDAKVKIVLKDSKGNPVEADVNVAAVDASLFDIGVYNYDLGLLDQLMKIISIQPLTNYTTYAQPKQEGGGGGGGGDAGVVRKDFKDNAIYQTVRTNKKGEAEVSFRVPDNIGAWRITTSAFDYKGLRAGVDKSEIIATLPVFADVTLNEVYLVGDEPQVRIRLAGGQYDSSKPATVSLSSSSLNLTKVETINKNSVTIPLGKLTEGTHKIVVQVKQGNNTDGVERTIRVINSRFEKTAVKEYDLTEGLTNIEGSQKSTTQLVFVDEGRGKYFYSLIDKTYSYNTRVDYAASEYEARKILHETYGWGEEPEPMNFAIYQIQSGSDSGLKLVPYGDEDLVASAWVAALIQDDGPSNLLASYFWKAMFNAQSDIHRTSQALFGLAALNQPVLSKIQTIKSDPNLTLEDRIYLATGLAMLGDSEGARQYYLKTIAPSVEIKKDTAYIKTEKDDDLQIKRTAQLGALYSTVGMTEEMDKALNFLNSHYSSKESIRIEQTFILKNAVLKNIHAEAKFSYQIGEEQKSIDLHNTYGFGLELMPQDLNQIKFSGIEGKVKLLSVYQQPGEAKPQDDPEVGIERKYYVNGKETTTFKEGDRVLVKLTVVGPAGAPNASYTVTDYLPSGLKASTSSGYVDYDWNGSYCNFSYPDTVYQNKLQFTLYRFRCGNKSEINYYARVVSLGTFTVDPAAVSPTADPTTINVSTKQTIQIKP